MLKHVGYGVFVVLVAAACVACGSEEEAQNAGGQDTAADVSTDEGAQNTAQTTQAHVDATTQDTSLAPDNATDNTTSAEDTASPDTNTDTHTDDTATAIKSGAPVVPNPAAVELGDFLFFGAPLDGVLSGRSFVGHIVSARQGAALEIEVTSGGAADDLTLHVFGPAQGAVFPNQLLAASDDVVGLDPGVSLVAPVDGKYLVVVGHFDGLTRVEADYTVSVTCAGQGKSENEACEAVSFAASECPLEFVEQGVGCVQDLLADEESGVTDLHEAAYLCADAEPLARAYDDQCVGDQRAIFCGVDYALFWQEINPACTDAIFFGAISHECRFGARFKDVRDQTYVAITRRQTLTSADTLSVEMQAQVVAAVNQSSHDVTSATEGFGAVDGGVIEQFELVDLARRRYTALEYGAGDNSYGAIFVGDSTDIAAAIIDGDLTNCLPPDAAAQPCAQSADCGELQCVGVFEGLGRCAAQTPSNGEGETCETNNSCEPGLFCTVNTVVSSGLCAAPWMVANFDATPFQTILDNDPQGLSAQIAVTGLATVSHTVSVQAQIHHPDLNQIQVYLKNPAGTEALVAQGQDAVAALALGVDVAGFPGDESANGPWTLRVVDGTAGGLGWLESWQLTLTIRLD